jgi:hypothetical protein
MKTPELVKHFLARSFAIFVVSIFAFFPILLRPPHLYLNAVLLALAIDYLIVGLLYLFIVTTAEPFLQKLISSSTKARRSSSNNDAVVASSESQRQHDDPFATVMAFYIINAFLLLATILFLWTTIWTSPNQGECRAASLFLDEVSPRCHFNRHFFFDLFFGMGESLAHCKEEASY